MKPLFFCLAMVTATAWGEGPYVVSPCEYSGPDCYQVKDSSGNVMGSSGSSSKDMAQDLAAALNLAHSIRTAEPGEINWMTPLEEISTGTVKDSK